MCPKRLVLGFTTVTTLLLSSASAMAQDPYPAPAPEPYPAQPGYAPPAYAPPGYAAPGYGAPAPYPAPVVYQRPGYHEHDGFFLRLGLGIGYLNNSASYQGSTMKVKGAGGSISIAAGGVVSRNLIIYGEIAGMSITDPTVELDGASGTASGSTSTLAGFGPGLAYYLDNNVYFSGTLLFTRLSASDSDTGDKTGESDLGFGTSLSAGKEWWVSHDWGIGVAGQLLFASMKEKDADYRWTSVGFAVLFSASYN